MRKSSPTSPAPGVPLRLGSGRYAIWFCQIAVASAIGIEGLASEVNFGSDARSEASREPIVAVGADAVIADGDGIAVGDIADTCFTSQSLHSAGDFLADIVSDIFISMDFT